MPKPRTPQRTICLHHYSSEPLDEILPPGPFVESQHDKPNPAFWLTPKNEPDNWPSFVIANEMGGDRIRYETAFHVYLERILELKTGVDLHAFTQNYKAPSPFKPYAGQSRWDQHYIDWKRVQEDGYQGIAIIPYQWSCRLAEGMLWYYGWDCASAAIWDLDAIARREKSRRIQFNELKIIEEDR